jgi:hypothetical protein
MYRNFILLLSLGIFTVALGVFGNKFTSQKREEPQISEFEQNSLEDTIRSKAEHSVQGQNTDGKNAIKKEQREKSYRESIASKEVKVVQEAQRSTINRDIVIHEASPTYIVPHPHSSHVVVERPPTTIWSHTVVEHTRRDPLWMERERMHDRQWYHERQMRHDHEDHRERLRNQERALEQQRASLERRNEDLEREKREQRRVMEENDRAWARRLWEDENRQRQADQERARLAQQRRDQEEQQALQARRQEYARRVSEEQEGARAQKEQERQAQEHARRVAEEQERARARKEEEHQAQEYARQQERQRLDAEISERVEGLKSAAEAEHKKLQSDNNDGVTWGALNGEAQ